MARMTEMGTIEIKIQKAEAKALKLKTEFDATLKELKSLHEKRKELQTAKLMDIIDKSGKTMDEVIGLIKL